MSLEDCLPPQLRAPTTTITRIGAGLSGAGVYRVEVGGAAYVLKVSSDTEPLDDWRRKVETRKAAAAAALAAPVVHVDEARRAVVSAFIADRGFAMVLFDPRTREAAITQLGQTVRRVHDLPLPAGAVSPSARELLAVWSSALPDGYAPAFVAEAGRRVLAEPEPPAGRALVLSHNDVNPTNLVYDGERLMLHDWETAGPNDPFYDLAAIAVFFRLDDDACLRMLAAHDGAPVASLPPRFSYDRRLIAILCGTGFIRFARENGHPGATGETVETAPSLVDSYARLRTGTLSVASAEGQWWFGLALVKAGLAV